MFAWSGLRSDAVIPRVFVHLPSELLVDLHTIETKEVVTAGGIERSDPHARLLLFRTRGLVGLARG